jgi:hypothetical protein
VLLSPALARSIGAAPALLASRRPPALAERLSALAGDRAALDALAAAARPLTQGRHWPAVAGRHLEIYEEVKRADRLARRRLRAA